MTGPVAKLDIGSGQFLVLFNPETPCSISGVCQDERACMSPQCCMDWKNVVEALSIPYEYFKVAIAWLYSDNLSFGIPHSKVCRRKAGVCACIYDYPWRALECPVIFPPAVYAIKHGYITRTKPY